MSRRRRGGPGAAFVFGLLLIVAGGAYLARNAGLIELDWNVLWPLLVIGLGLVVIAAALEGGRGYAPRGAGGDWSRGGGGDWSRGRHGYGTGTSTVSVPVDGARRLDLSLRVGAGRYRLAGGSASLVEVVSDEPTIDSALDRQGDVVRMRLSPAVDWWRWPWHGGLAWQIGVARDVPTTLEVQAGAGSFELDLSEVSIVSASVSVGAADLRVVLPRPRGEVPISVEGGAAGMTFQVPPGVEARVSSTGLVATSGRTETPGYATATDRVTVSVTGGAASVRVV